MLHFSGSPELIQRFSVAARSIDPVAIVTPRGIPAVRDTVVASLLKNGRLEKAPAFDYNQDYLRSLAELKGQFMEDATDLGRFIESDAKVNSAAYQLDHWLLQLLSRRRSDTYLALKLATGILYQDDRESAVAVSGIYGRPSSQDVKSARLTWEGLLAASGQRRKKFAESPFVYQDYQIAATFDRLIAAYGFRGWSAEVTDAASAIDVRDSLDKVLIPTGRRLNEPTLVKRSAHEIECHLRGSCNVRALLAILLPEESGLSSLIPWLAKAYDEEIYEGVAKISDVTIEANNLGNGGSELPIPWYILGIDRAIEDGATFVDSVNWFYERFKELRMGSEKAALEAWNKSYRIYRGITHPTCAGYIFTKDRAYHTGYYNLQTLQARQPELRALTEDFSTLTLAEIQGLRACWLKVCASGSKGKHALASLLEPAYPKLHLATSDTTLPDAI